MMTMSRVIGGVLGAGLLSMLAACGGEREGGGPGEVGGEPEAGGTAIIAEGSDMNQPNALLVQGGLDGNLQDILYMTLLRGAWRDGRLAYLTAEESPMALARAYEYTGADSASIRYHLRTDARWSDGQPITAHDVTFTYERLRDPQLASPRQDYTENIDSVVAENDSTVLFRFDRRYPEMRFHSGHGIVPRHLYESVEPAEFASHPSNQNPANGALVVSGPYLISDWQRGRQVVLSRNPHFQPQGHLDQIVFRIIPEIATRLVEVQTGNIDWMPGVTFDQIPALRQQAPNIRFEREEKRFFDYIAYNPHAYPAFADAEIRRALGLAIDAPRVIAALQMSDYAIPAAGPYPPIFEDLYDPERMAPLEHDAEEAKRILAAKGWRDSNGDGIVEQDGHPFHFTLVTNAGNQRRADVMQIVQQQWRALGVDAQLRAVEFNTFMDALVEHNFEAALGGWSVALSADLSGMWGAGSPYNIVSYSNPETLALFDRALSQPTDEAATPIWKAAAARLIQDQPYTWLYYFDQVNAINNRLRGVEVNTFGPYQNAWEWWIPRELQRGGRAAAGADSTQ